ncbi:membrane-associated proteins in eicosanoid and glutathione metabolism [Ramaria rubella]|nr:membrane-associated proteins in eicosanoid and glutathione metabolism [Ramaria rubella]
MSLTLALPERYAWVLLVGAGAGWLNIWQTLLVGRARKAAKIPYPQAYAEKAEASESKEALVFNCTQRAHQNTLEVLPFTLFSLLVSGLKYPTVATGFGVVWLLGRVLYTSGYTTGDPKKRARGIIGNVGLLGLLLTSSYYAGELVYNTL